MMCRTFSLNIHFSLLELLFFGQVDISKLYKISFVIVLATLSSSLIIGPCYAFVIRAIKADEDAIETWFDNIRERLRNGPSIPLFSLLLPLLTALLGAIYGVVWWRRALTSLAVAAVLSISCFFVILDHYSGDFTKLRAEKSLLEKEIDPKLYSYFNDPDLRVEYEKAWEQELDGAALVSDVEGWHLKYQGGIYDELRERTNDFNRKFAAKIRLNTNCVGLTMLYLREGTYLDSKPRIWEVIALFTFNVILDFAGITLLQNWLIRSDDGKIKGKMIWRLLGLLGILGVLTVLSLSSYINFFRGNAAIFWQVELLPISLIAIAMGAILVIAGFSKESDMPTMSPWWGILIVAAGVWGLRYIWSYWSLIPFVDNIPNVVTFPFVLSFVPLLPAICVLVSFFIIILTSTLFIPASAFVERAMHFIRFTAKGTYVGSIIALLSNVVAALISYLSS